MGFLDFLKGKSRSKPHDMMRSLSVELKDLPSSGNVQALNISDEECNELENYLAAACAGTTANVYIKKHPKPDEIEKCLSNAENSDIMIHIANKITVLEPETRRIVCAIWGYLLKMEHPKSFQRPMVEYLTRHLSTMDALIQCYGKNTGGADVTIGVMIRDATRFQKVIDYVFKKNLVLSLLPVLTSANFDVSADAFQTLKEMLTNHKEVSAPWLSRHFDKFFEEYMKPLKAGSDYVTVRQSLSILSTILLDRQFMDAMIQFVAKEEYLKAILILLGNSSKVVQFEAFHIFKIFAANPNKTLKIKKLLVQNYERIVKLLDHIEQYRAEDSEFRQDKTAVVAKLQSLTERSKNDSVASKKPPIQGSDSLPHVYQVS